MSRGRIALIIGAYFAAALIFSIFEIWLEPFPVWNSVTVGRAVGGALGLFLMSGILPLVFWAIWRFRTERAGTILTTWAVLGLIIGALMADGNQIQIQDRISKQTNALLVPGKVHDDFVRGVTLKCIDDNRSAAINKQAGLTEAQISRYCDCVGNAISLQISTDELKEYVQSGKPADSLRDKMIRRGTTCGSTAIGTR